MRAVVSRRESSHTRTMPGMSATPRAESVTPYIDVTVVARMLEQLAGARAEDGGWGTVSDRAADAESTAWVLLGAARLTTLVPSLDFYRHDARRWLLTQQQADGSWTYRQGPSISTWPTAPAILALAADREAAADAARGSTVDARASDDPPETRPSARSESGDAHSAVAADSLATSGSSNRALTWLVAEHSVTPAWWQRLLRRFATSSPSSSDTTKVAEPAVVLDASLDGFGWARNTFAWVEPTAVAMLALSTVPSDATHERIAIGARLLLDRQSPDGGWNYGNKRVLGVDLPGYPDTTAWALLALAAVRGANVPVPDGADDAASRAFTALTQPESNFESPLAIALEMLAHLAFRRTEATQVAEAATRLQRALTIALDGVRDGYPMLDTRTIVLSLMALYDVSLVRLTPTALGASVPR